MFPVVAGSRVTSITPPRLELVPATPVRAGSEPGVIRFELLRAELR